MNYDQILNERIQGIKPSGIRKFFDILEEMTDAISLGIGEPDFVTPWHIRDAGIYSLERGHTKYTSNAGMLELRREIANYLKRQPDSGHRGGQRGHRPVPAGADQSRGRGHCSRPLLRVLRAPHRDGGGNPGVCGAEGGE